MRTASLRRLTVGTVAAGLVLGKPLGILAFSWLAVRCGAAQLPAGVNQWSLLGAGCLGGIGFTMSLFIASLALEGTPLDAAKIGILAGSTISAAAGLVVLLAFLPVTPPAAATEDGQTSPDTLEHATAESP